MLILNLNPNFIPFKNSVNIPVVDFPSGIEPHIKIPATNQNGDKISYTITDTVLITCRIQHMNDFFRLILCTDAIKRMGFKDIEEFTIKNKDSLYESYGYGYNKNNKVVSGNLLSCFYYVFKAINEVAADDFCHKVSSGLDITDKSPIFILRNCFQADLRAKRKMPSLQKMVFIIKAWNLYRSNKTVVSLRWDSATDPFPKPQ